MSETPERRNSISLRFVFLTGAALLVVTGAVVMVALLRSQQEATADRSVPLADSAAQIELSEEQLAQTNAVTVVLGGVESGQGLRLVETENDGVTAIESRDGAPVRVARLVEGRTTVYFYFQIHPAFKASQELRGARIDVEYLAPQPGTMGIHYDAQDAEDVSNPIYREALRNVRLGGSNVWQVASFRTKNDGLFEGRQNGRSDFRLWARTPELYVRRVTVTRDVVDEFKWVGDFSTSNQVSILLGQEKPTDGLRHLAEEGDGRTRIETLDGITCRYLNRVADNKSTGFLYFSLAPSFKRNALNGLNGLKNARVDIEYLAVRPGYFRLQFDGMEGDTRRKYSSVLPLGARLVRFGPSTYARIPTIGTWATATFHITNALFQNGQNGDADFRLEVAASPEIYLRRVTVTREEGLAASVTR